MATQHRKSTANERESRASMRLLVQNWREIANAKSISNIVAPDSCELLTGTPGQRRSTIRRSIVSASSGRSISRQRLSIGSGASGAARIEHARGSMRASYIPVAHGVKLYIHVPINSPERLSTDQQSARTTITMLDGKLNSKEPRGSGK